MFGGAALKRLFIALSLVLPAGWLLLAALFPQIDRTVQVPLLHFYVVTFFTFAAAVVTFFTAAALGQSSAPRHQLLATAFAVMGSLFFIHGVTTPNALIFAANPGIRWAAWLTLFLGGVVFALAALDSPQRPLPLKRLDLIHWALAIFCGGFILIVAFRSQWLGAIDAQAAPWHQQTVFVLTLLIWLFAAVRLWRTWRQTALPVDGVMALIAAWFAIGSISMHAFAAWKLSWWLYHVQLLLGVITAVWALSQTYEQLRQFRLTTYYTALGLIVTAGLALLASHLVSQFVEQNLLLPLGAQLPATAEPLIAPAAMTEMIVRARLTGLLIASSALGALFLVLLVVVRRADRLITTRSDELAAAYANLQAAEALRDDLTDMVVHDLRTPLTSMRLSLDLLEKLLDAPEQAEFRQRLIDNAQGSVEQMLVLINQMLDLAKLEAGQLNLSCQPLALPQLLQEKAQFYMPQAEASEKHIYVETQPDLPLISADPDLVGRVVDNLVGNALKYTRAGGRISLCAQASGTAVLVQVADDGEGIAPEAAARIFDKFYQVTDAEGQPLRRGTGLGLSFCKLVVEAHNGRIWVDSQPGQGSTFSFTLPIPS
ncbi:MAG: hypothetical protein H6661_13510 [Ardenticatenaceae bacterium]|nr:hypothetical protein [Ardenticatenaceae bacterium]